MHILNAWKMATYPVKRFRLVLRHPSWLQCKLRRFKELLLLGGSGLQVELRRCIIEPPMWRRAVGKGSSLDALCQAAAKARLEVVHQEAHW